MGWSGPTSTKQLYEETQTGSYAKTTIFQNNHKTENDTVQKRAWLTEEEGVLSRTMFGWGGGSRLSR